MRPRVFVVLLLALALAAACSPDDSEPAVDEHLPPNDFEELVAMFDDELEPLGLQMTRGALVDTTGGYEESDTGRHLAVYVEPTGEYTTADYTDGIVPSAQVFLPEVFERWDRLETFDVCQEPLPGADDRKEPPPVTQLYVSREEADAIDWETVGLAELVDAAQPARRDFRLYVAPAVTSDPSFTEATG
jgi:hypothetical protein